MPYSIRKGGGSCSKAEWAVVKTSTGKSVGCHKTKASARKQLAALQINVMSKEGAMPHVVHETATLSERATTGKGGRWKVKAITAGLGSSGYYSPKVLENAAANELIKAGTPLFFDHASESERTDRPERSVRDIAAVFTSPASYDARQEALVGEVQVFGPYRELVTEMAPHIGLSISGSATDITEGTVDGRKVPVIEDLFAIGSVDLVTKAGRGGEFVSLLESARAETERQAEAAGADLSEATYSDKQTALCDAVKTAYGEEKTYAWVRDFDDETVWFEVSTSDSEGLYGQGYSFDAASGQASLTGSRTEVRAVTNYVPATRPDGKTTTESQEEIQMGTKQIEESEFTRLTEAAGRVDTLEAELKKVQEQLAAATKTEESDDTAPIVTGPRAVVQKHITEQDDRIARLEAREGARQVIAEVLAEGWIGDAQKGRLSSALMGDLPMADGKLDEQALRTKATDLLNEAETETAEILEHAGVGEVKGLGGLTTPGIEVAGKKFEDELTESFKRRGLSESAAQIAVKGH